MKTKTDLVKGWLQKGDNDLKCVRILVSEDGPGDNACFHIEQAVEKYLKGFLVHRDQNFPFIHDLEELADICQNADSNLDLTNFDLEGITKYAVEM